MGIPVCEPLLNGNEERYVVDCLRSGWVSSAGEYVDRFEKAFADYCGCVCGVSTTSGTTALHLALASLGIGEGDEVIVPTLTIASCAFAVLYTGARPVFVDCDPVTFNMDPELAQKAVTDRTRAIMPVHLYGHPCDMDEIGRIARDNRLFLVEDAAEAHGAEYKGRRVGGFGEIGCFSFFANKVITTGEGGMLVMNDPALAGTARRLKNLAHSQVRFLHHEIGFNYRMTNIQAAIGLAQLERIDMYLEKRRKNAERYTTQLAKIDGITTPMELPYARNSFWMYAILLESREKRDGLMRHLAQKEIGSRTFFIPLHQQPILKQYTRGDFCEFPVADDVSARGMYLPSGTGLTVKEIDAVCDAVKEYLHGH